MLLSIKSSNSPFYWFAATVKINECRASLLKRLYWNRPPQPALTSVTECHDEADKKITNSQRIILTASRACLERHWVSCAWKHKPGIYILPWWEQQGSRLQGRGLRGLWGSVTDKLVHVSYLQKGLGFFLLNLCQFETTEQVYVTSADWDTVNSTLVGSFLVWWSNKYELILSFC